MKRVKVDWDYNSRHVYLHLAGTSEELYDTWKASGLDSDFDVMTDWIIDSVIDKVDIYIEDVRDAE